MLIDTLETSPEDGREPRFADQPQPFLILAWTEQGTLQSDSGPHLARLRDGLVIGRQYGFVPSGLKLDRTVSREHVKFTQRDQDWWIEDLESRNGTFVDGKYVEGATKISDGTIIFVGSYVFVLRWLSVEQVRMIRAECAQPLTPTPTFSSKLAETYQRLRLLDEAKLDLFISGETGTGKEVLARAIYDLNGGKGKFVALNCAALPEALVESELFGFRRGSHSNAKEGKIGLLEVADGGTLFLDEIGEAPSSVQAKLLRFLQDGTFTPLGAVQPVKVHTRVIAASHRHNLSAHDEQRGLRPDLANRLGPEPIVLPALRDRIEDLGILIENALQPAQRITDRAVRSLFLCAWKGNVRQLFHTLRYASALAAKRDCIDIEDLPKGWDDAAPLAPPEPLAAITSILPTSVEQRATPNGDELQALMRSTQGDVAAAARILGRQRTLVWKWLRKHQIDPKHYRLAPTDPVSQPPAMDPGTELP